MSKKIINKMSVLPLNHTEFLELVNKTMPDLDERIVELFAAKIADNDIYSIVFVLLSMIEGLRETNQEILIALNLSLK